MNSQDDLPVALGANGNAMQALELKIPPVVLAFITAVLMRVLASVVPNPGFAFSAAPVVAVMLASAGAVVSLSGVLEFRSAGTTVDPRAPGQSVSLVIRGVYRFSRNPMYLGLFFVLSAWGIYLANVPALVLLPAFVLYMNRFQVEPEERHMRAKFGEEFQRYTDTVRRWI